MREWYFAKNGYLASFSELRINKFFKAKKIRDNLVFDSDKKEKKLWKIIKQNHQVIEVNGNYLDKIAGKQILVNMKNRTL